MHFIAEITITILWSIKEGCLKVGHFVYFVKHVLKAHNSEHFWLDHFDWDEDLKLNFYSVDVKWKSVGLKKIVQYLVSYKRVVNWTFYILWNSNSLRFYNFKKDVGLYLQGRQKINILLIHYPFKSLGLLSPNRFEIDLSNEVLNIDFV